LISCQQLGNFGCWWSEHVQPLLLLTH